jgi:hypothetical protein
MMAAVHTDGGQACAPGRQSQRTRHTTVWPDQVDAAIAA